MHGTRPGRRTRAAGGSTHLRIAIALAAVALAGAPAAHAQVTVPGPTGVVGALPAAPQDCAGANGGLAPAALRAAMLCAINVERARHGLRALPADPRVETAATAQV